LVAQGDQDRDGDNRNESENQGVLHESLPFLLFIRRSAILALVITLLIIVFSPPLNKKCSKTSKMARGLHGVGLSMTVTLSRIISHANRKMQKINLFKKQ